MNSRLNKFKKYPQLLLSLTPLNTIILLINQTHRPKISYTILSTIHQIDNIKDQNLITPLFFLKIHHDHDSKK